MSDKMRITRARRMQQQIREMMAQGHREIAEKIKANLHNLGAWERVARLNQGDPIWAKDLKTELERLVVRVREKGDNQRFLPVPHETRLLVRAYLGHPDLDAIDRALLDGDQVLFVSTNCHTVPPHEYYGEARRLAIRSIADMMEKHGKDGATKENGASY